MTRRNFIRAFIAAAFLLWARPSSAVIGVTNEIVYPSQTLVAFAGAETGDLGEIGLVRGTVIADSTVSVLGAFSYKTGNNIGGNSSVSIKSGLAATTLYARCYVKTSMTANATSTVDILGTWTASLAAEVGRVVMSWAAAGGVYVIQLLNGGTQIGSNFSISLSDWHRIELKEIISTTVGELHLLVDGFEVAGSTGLNTGSTAIDQVLFGADNVAASMNGFNWIDDCAISITGFIGAGHSVAFQPGATTPNYNAWTKSTGTISSCWNTTPFNTTTFVSDAVSSDKQTGVPSTVVILPTNGINSAKIGWYGKTSSVTTDGADSSIFRTPAGASGSDTIQAGSVYTTGDTYQQIYISPTPTSPQIGNCEYGIQHGTGTNTHTVEDAWLIADYASG